MTASATIDATPQAPAPAWTRVGRIASGEMAIANIVGFAGGFVVTGGSGLDGARFAFSADGREWEDGSLAQPTPDCDGNPTSDAYVTGATTDGQRVLVLGKRLEFTVENCSDPDAGVGAGAIAWLSTDGQTWTRSSDFAHSHGIASYAWPIPGGGWEASVSSWDQPTAIWQSADGMGWHETASFPEQVGSSARGAADAAGTRLLKIQPDEEPLRFVSSNDGVAWDPLSAQPAVSEFAFVTGVLAPAGPGRPWIVTAGDDQAGSSIWTSADLGAWAEHDFPGQRIVTDIFASTDGFLATAERADLYQIECDGAPCPGPAERQYFSPDGAAWDELPFRIRGGAFFAESPAGLIAVGRYNNAVWHLQR